MPPAHPPQPLRALPALLLVGCALALSACTGSRSCPSGAVWRSEPEAQLKFEACWIGARLTGGPARTLDADGRVRFEGAFAIDERAYGARPLGILQWYYTNGSRRAELSYPSRSLLDYLLSHSGRLGRWGLKRLKQALQTSPALQKSPSIRIEHSPREDALAALRARLGASPGTLDGKATAWNHDGSKIFEASFRDGAPQGTWTAWHRNGARAFEGKFDRGLQVGTWKYWYPNGQLALQAEYASAPGAPDPSGPWRAWNSDGTELRAERKPTVADSGAAETVLVPVLSQAPASSTLSDLWLWEGFDRVMRLFGEVLSEFTVREPKRSPFGRIDEAGDLKTRGWLDFDLGEG